MIPVLTGRARPRLAGIAMFAAFTAVVIGVTHVPYAFATAAAPPDRQFMGIVLNVPDTAQYLSWAREFRHGWLVENKLTPEPGEPVFFNLFWLVVGRAAAWAGSDVAQALPVARVVAAVANIGAIFWFTGLVARDRLERWVSFLVATLGGGLGWALVILKQFTGVLSHPLDVYVTEPNTFLTVLAFPHQAMATGLLIAILALAALAFERGNLRLAFASGALALALGLQHGYDLVIVYAVVGATAAALAVGRDRRAVGRLFVQAVAMVGWSAPAALYLVYLTRTSPIWRGVLAQYGNAGVYTPPPAHLLVLMGLPLLLTLCGVPAVLRRVSRQAFAASFRSFQSRPREVLLGVWLVIGFLLLYLPTDFQIKMLAGWQVPVAIYATRVALARRPASLQRWLSPVGALSAVGQGRVVIGAALVLAVLPVNVYLYAWRFVDLGRHDYPYYLAQDDLSALRWLEANALPSDVVLSDLIIGQYIPSVSGNRAFLAHWAETLDYYRKVGMVARFFDSSVTDDERLETLDRFDVRYVFYGQREQALGNYEMARSPFLSRVFDSGRSAVYRVETPTTTAAVRMAGNRRRDDGSEAA